MGFLDSVLKVFVGDKAKQDVKAIMPIVEQVKSHEKAMEALSIDELRNKTVAFKAKIEDALKDINAEKESLKSEADASTDIDRNEDIIAKTIFTNNVGINPNLVIDKKKLLLNTFENDFYFNVKRLKNLQAK